MGAISKVREALANPRNSASKIGSPFIEIDREATAQRLRLEERAAENGALNLPPSSTTTFDHVETEIVAVIGDEVARTNIEAAEQLGTYNQRLLQLHRLNETTTIAGAARAALADLPAQMRESQDRVALLRDAASESFQEVTRFRTAHNLDRPAHDAPPGVSTTGAIIGMWLADSAMNTAFLRINDDLGILGGAVAAALVAGFNVVLLGYVAGRWLLPNTQHRDGWRRRLAGTALIIWLIVVVVWNLVAAHYRDAKSLGHTAPEQEAVTMLFEQPFALDGIMTFAFFFAGILFATIAAFRYFAMDDPYPGYGKVWRRHQQRCDDYANEVSDAKADLREMRDAAVAKAANMRAELATQFSEHGQISAHRSAFVNHYYQHLERLERDGNALLQQYRLANRQKRSEPAPPHFDQHWQLARGTAPDNVPPPQMPANLPTEVTAAQSALEKAIDEINDAFIAAERSFKTLDELKTELARG